jgi:hypothetical protein
MAELKIHAVFSMIYNVRYSEKIRRSAIQAPRDYAKLRYVLD